MIISSAKARSSEITLERVSAWDNLLLAWQKASRGKRGKSGVAAFEHRLADRLLVLQDALRDSTWRPGGYVHFLIREPKRRRISAAPFADRVVHHALCNVIEPVFERLFIPESFANRPGRGTHLALDRLQSLARRYRYVLLLDIVKHFPSIDHAILLETLGRHLTDPRLLALAGHIVASGDGVLDQEYQMVWFPGDDLLAACRPRGLPIGNLTSQFWSNCYLHPFDQFVQRELGCRAYLRYVDDFALFSDSKRELLGWKQAIIGRIARLRLVIHATRAQVVPVECGIPWLGFLVYPTYRLVKARKVRHTHRRLRARLDAYHAGEISFGELEASIRGWIAHVGHADTWGLRQQVLDGLVIRPAEHHRALANRRMR
jgi:retron-type reverse transcriptase